jgi:hypothetical protein
VTGYVSGKNLELGTLLRQAQDRELVERQPQVGVIARSIEVSASDVAISHPGIASHDLRFAMTN